MPPTTPQYCTKGHENPSGSRFCLRCGEQMGTTTDPQGIYSGLILGDRYRIIQQLGQGGFGKTYLAEDINRFNEACVLKEFAPQVQTSAVLQKAEELFAREAGVLYQLQHPQIPRFRELFRVNVEGKGYLFLVQDYVEGKNLFSLLYSRQPARFSEGEVTQLLLDILPVLEYIHSIGVIHRDISPDNLILRSDSRPVLIDFGGVKQIAATVSQLAQSEAGKASPPATLLGKVGYAPNEQMRTGTVYPHSDLYALAVTVLVLLTGKEPQALIDPRTLSWQWEREVNVSNTLAMVLNKMLQPKMSDRYQTAREVWQALNVSSNNNTLPVSPAYTGASVINNYQPPIANNYSRPAGFPIGKTILGFLVLFGLGSVTFWGVGSLLQSRNVTPPVETPSPPVASISPLPSPSPEVQLPAAERALADALIAKRQNLGISENYYFSVMYRLFWAKYPDWEGRKLTNDPAYADIRQQWYKIADQLLNKLETISVTSRQKLGSYTKADRDRTVAAINQVFVGSRSLYDLTDAAFFTLFPDQKGKNFLTQPVGQIWNAIAQDKASNIIAGTAYEKVAFAPGATNAQLSGTLNPGEGKVFVAQLVQDQLMQLNIQAEPQVLISVYSPTGKTKLLEDSTTRTLSVTLPEDGYYEIVVVSTATAPMDYQFTLSVEDQEPEPEPIIEPIVPETPTPTPTETLPVDTP